MVGLGLGVCWPSLCGGRLTPLGALTYVHIQTHTHTQKTTAGVALLAREARVASIRAVHEVVVGQQREGYEGLRRGYAQVGMCW